MKKSEQKKLYKAIENYRWSIKPIIDKLEKKERKTKEEKGQLKWLKNQFDNLHSVSEQYKSSVLHKNAISYSELSRMFTEINDKKLPHKVGYIVYNKQNFDKKYQGLDERTYGFSSDNKVFQSWKGGYSLFGSNLTNTDECVRPERIGWEIEYCYIED